MNFAAAKSLADRGSSALPDIERAFNSLERTGERSIFARNAGWIVLAYARILGPTAYSRLRPMMSTSNLYFLHRSLDRSVALSMNLTSYVSNFRPEDFRGRDITFQRFRDPEPRDGLDQFIRAWEANDRESFEATLGPNARIALQGLLDGRTWADMREELWRGKAGDILGLGYQFETSGIWSESEEMLDQEFDAYKEHLRYPVNPETDTLFKNSAGVECGHYRIKLIQASRRSNVLYPPYLIDNRDLGDLLRLIVSCCVEISKKP